MVLELKQSSKSLGTPSAANPSGCGIKSISEMEGFIMNSVKHAHGRLKRRNIEQSGIILKAVDL